MHIRQGQSAEELEELARTLINRLRQEIRESQSASKTLVSMLDFLSSEDLPDMFIRNLAEQISGRINSFSPSTGGIRLRVYRTPSKNLPLGRTAPYFVVGEVPQLKLPDSYWQLARVNMPVHLSWLVYLSSWLLDASYGALAVPWPHSAHRRAEAWESHFLLLWRGLGQGMPEGVYYSNLLRDYPCGLMSLKEEAPRYYRRLFPDLQNQN